MSSGQFLSCEKPTSPPQKKSPNRTGITSYTLYTLFLFSFFLFVCFNWGHLYLVDHRYSVQVHFFSLKHFDLRVIIAVIYDSCSISNLNTVFFLLLNCSSSVLAISFLALKMENRSFLLQKLG